MYEQESQSTGHADVSSADSIAKLSYVVVQELKHFSGTHFTPFIHSFPTPSFHHLPGWRLIQKVGAVGSLPDVSLASMINIPRAAVETLKRWQTEKDLIQTALTTEKRERRFGNIEETQEVEEEAE